MPRPLPCAQREKIASLPLPCSKARLRLLSVRFISSHLSQSLAGGDRPGFSGTGRVWRVGKVSLAGDIHPGLCGVTATKRGENLTLVWQGLGWAAQRNPAPRGVGRGSPGCGVHPELIQNCESRTQPLLGVRGVGAPLPAWAVCWGDMVGTPCSVQGFSCPSSWRGSEPRQGLCIQLCVCLLLTVN